MGLRGNAQRLYGERMRKFLEEHPGPVALPEPNLERAEDYVRTANNNFTAFVGEESSVYQRKSDEHLNGVAERGQKL